jgi:hypothetical protein
MVTEELLPKITGFNAADDELVKRDPFRRLRKKAKVQARESRAARRTGSTPQRPRDEAQRRDWTFFEVVKNRQYKYQRVLSNLRRPAIVLSNLPRKLEDFLEERHLAAI